MSKLCRLAPDESERPPDPDLQAIGRGELTPDLERLIARIAEPFAGQWWRGHPNAKAQLVDRVGAHLARFGLSGREPLSKRLQSALSQSEQGGADDAVMDTLVASVKDILRDLCWGSPDRHVFVRCFLMEILLVEAFLMERADPAPGDAATALLWDFGRRKAHAVAARVLHGRGHSPDDAVAFVMQGLLGFEPRWGRRTLLDFDRSKASLAGFIMRAIQYHAGDLLRHPADLPLDAGNERAETPHEPSAAAIIPEDDATDLLRAVLESGADVPPPLNPVNPTGRRWLALLQGRLLSEVADEDHDAYTCPDGTRQLKFVLTQGHPPALAIGSLGGNGNHPRYGDIPENRSGAGDNAVNRGFSEESCKLYPVQAEDQDFWTHWKVLYTLAFFGVGARVGWLERERPAAAHGSASPPTLALRDLTRLCLRRTMKETFPTKREVGAITDSYRKWIQNEYPAIPFAVDMDETHLRPGHRYPHVLLSAYAANAFVALYAGFRLNTSVSVEEVRFGLHDLRRAMKKIKKERA
jgi:hypothetical protein